jgi:hypothetical protein
MKTQAVYQRMLLFVLLVSGTSGWLHAEAPHAQRLEPRTAKPGQEITVQGVLLDPSRVEEVYLTDHKFDMKVKVLIQKDEELKFRIPPFAKAGRMQLLFLTKGDTPKLLEQPVYLLIEDGSAELTQAKEPAPVKDAAKEKDGDPKEGNKEPVKQ